MSLLVHIRKIRLIYFSNFLCSLCSKRYLQNKMSMFATLVQNTIDLMVVLFHFVTLWPLGIIKCFLPKNKKDINGEIMFMTGAGNGMGRFMSIKFADLGAILVCTDINEESAAETANMIKSKGGKAYSYQLDVTDRQQVYNVANRVKDDVGQVTMLVNNAGIVTGKLLMDCPDELIQRTMDVNCTAHFWTIKAFLGSMLAKNHGHIISIASIAGHAGGPHVVDYCTSKYGAVGLHDSLLRELAVNAKNNIKMSVVCPYFIKTGMFDGAVSRSPLTLPMLNVEYAVDQIVSGVLNNEVEIFVPKKLMAIPIFKSVAPTDVQMKLARYMKLDEQMVNFVGRNGKNKKEN